MKRWMAVPVVLGLLAILATADDGLGQGGDKVTLQLK